MELNMHINDMTPAQIRATGISLEEAVKKTLGGIKHTGLVRYCARMGMTIAEVAESDDGSVYRKVHRPPCAWARSARWFLALEAAYKD
jgi:hypothetical protein